jgi:regulatory protein
MMERNNPPPQFGRVSGISDDPRHPTAVRVSVEGRITWTLPRGAVAELAIAVGQLVDDDLKARLDAAADQEGAWRALLRHLERRSFARYDLGRRLRQKAHSADAVEAALERADEAGLLDDVAFARNYAETRSARGRGPARLKRDLSAQGVSREVIDRVLRELWPDGEGPINLARTLAAKRAGQLKSVPVPVRLRRVLAYLARRGFSGHQARGVVDEVVGGRLEGG